MARALTARRCDRTPPRVVMRRARAAMGMVAAAFVAIQIAFTAPLGVSERAPIASPASSHTREQRDDDDVAGRSLSVIGDGHLENNEAGHNQPRQRTPYARRVAAVTLRSSSSRAGAY